MSDEEDKAGREESDAIDEERIRAIVRDEIRKMMENRRSRPVRRTSEER